MLKGIVSGSPVDITRIAMKGKNLFDGIIGTDNVILNQHGNPTPNNAYALSKYIPVEPNTTYTYHFYHNTDENRSTYTISEYDSDRNAIQPLTLHWITENRDYAISFTTQANTAYIRINWKKARDEDLMLNTGSTSLPYEPYGMQSGWEVRDQQGRIIWGADKTLTGTDSISYKGYGLDIKEYDIDGNMVQAAEKEYSITGTSPLDFQSNGSNATISISGNETQASNQAYTTSGTSPLSFNADGTNLTALSMDGNMNQASTPSPSSPITPIECGVKTANLWDYLPVNSTLNGVTIVNDNGVLKFSGTCDASANFQTTRTIAAGTYTISANANHNPSSDNYACIQVITTDLSIGAQVNNSQAANGYSTFTLVSENSCQVRIRIQNGVNYDGFELRPMMNTGSSALPFEPYGKYKIPITVGSTTKNIFINQPIRKIGNYSDSIGSDGVITRNIKKLVLTGEETWVYESAYTRFYMEFQNSLIIGLRLTPAFCTHFQVISDGRPIADVPDDSMYSNSNVDMKWFFKNTEYTSVDAWKYYLTQQYQNGTPVTVWYVLATPDTTETTTIPTISTVNGSDTLTTGTPITPSNITISTSSSVYPKNPIYPEECGNKTDNLWNEDYTPVSTALKYVPIYVGNGDFTLSTTCPKASGDKYPCLFFFAGIASSGAATGANDVRLGLSRTVTAIDGYVTVAFRSYDDVKPADYQTMLNTGSTAATYEPFGYKIPVTIGSNTNYIYTKEPIRKIGNYADVVNSDGSITRYISKRILTGKESIGTESHMYNISGGVPAAIDSWYSAFCTHYIGATSYSQCNSSNGYFGVSNRSGAYIWFNQGSFAESTDFKQWLADEYSANRPVCVWYVLSTPTTEQTTIPTLTTVNGKNTATIGTTLAPSSITINATSKVYPNNPIIPEECGDLTENLTSQEDVTSTGYYVILSSGGLINALKKCTPDTDYTLSWDFYSDAQTEQGNVNLMVLWNSSHSNLKTIFNGTSFTLPSSVISDLDSVVLYFGSLTTSGYMKNFMLNAGSTAKPYEPYGKYKVPIINNGTTQKIYLNQPIRKIGNYSDIINSDGTVTRYIKKLVLTGKEAWQLWNGNYFSSVIDRKGAINAILCSHFINSKSNGMSYDNWSSSGLEINASAVPFVSNVTELKQWLSDQYSASNPVEVWYVLATPETESTTAPTISTIEGTNSIEVDTTLSPSKIDITGHIKYSS